VRKIRECPRLKAEARLSNRQIAAAIGSARSTAHKRLRRARAAGISWRLPAELDDGALFARLYPRTPTALRYPTPDCPTIQAALAEKRVTRTLLWQEARPAASCARFIGTSSGRPVRGSAAGTSIGSARIASRWSTAIQISQLWSASSTTIEELTQASLHPWSVLC
jgi:Winged helix-turn-helix DNA-binding